MFLSLWFLLPLLPAFLAQRPIWALIATAVYGLIVASLLSHKLLVSEAPVMMQSTFPYPFQAKVLARVWAVTLVASQAAIVMRIVAERDRSPGLPIKTVAGFLAEILSSFLPALRDFPLDMARSGFARTAGVVTDSFALAYTAALINLAALILLSGWIVFDLVRRRELGPLPQGFPLMPTRRKVGVLLVWLTLPTVYLYGSFITTGVQIVAGQEEFCPSFETSEVQLYCRTLGMSLSVVVFGWMLVMATVAVGFVIFRLLRHRRPAS